MVSIDIAAAAVAVLAEPAPLVMADTCSILDVVRAPARDNVPPDLAQTASRMISAASATPSGLWVCVAPEVPTEFTNNIESARLDLERFVRHTEARIFQLNTGLAALGLPVSVPHGTYLASGIVEAAELWSSELMNIALHLEEDPAVFATGAKRAYQGLAPGRKGGQIKDCVIVQHCIAFAEALRGLGFLKQIVFVSSNIKDYCGEGAQLHPDLREDFSRHNIAFVTDFKWAASLIGI